jgi:transcriptional regulator NrdR family protein
MSWPSIMSLTSLHILREQKKHNNFAREKFLKDSLQALKSHQVKKIQVKTKVEP